MYDYNANFSLTENFEPRKNSDAETIVDDLDGIACEWVNDSSGESIVIAAAHPDAKTVAALRGELASDSESVSTYGSEGYFTVEDGVGRADAVADPFWVSGDSDYFFEPGDAAPLMKAAVANLR
jgi:hypothetical protein